MNKKLIAVAIAGAFAGASSAVMAGEAQWSSNGFVDSIFTLQSSGCDNAANALGASLNNPGGCSTSATDVDGNAANSVERTFATSGEIDVMGSANGVTGRIDLDIGGGSSGSATTEQAVISWMASDSVTVNFGRMNSGVGFEAEDAPNMNQTTHGAIWNAIDSQTSLPGNNVEGVVAAIAAGPATINVGVLNEIGGVVADENSYLIQASGEVMDGLKLNLAYLTQADNTPSNPNSGENLMDFYATYGMDNWWVNLEIADAAVSADGFFDMAYGLTGHMDFGSGFGGTLRYENVSYNDIGSTSVDDTTTLTVFGSYAAADNLSLNLEINNVDVGGTTDKANEVLLEALATF